MGLAFVFALFCSPVFLLPLSLSIHINSTHAAKAEAQALDSHYRHTLTLAAIFFEKYTSGGSSLRAESGRVYFSKPGRMRWDYDSPEKKLFLVDGKNVWYYVPSDHTASRTSIKQSDDWRTPLALLAGKVKLEQLCGELQLADPANPGDPQQRATQTGNSVLVCSPRKNESDAFRQILLEINSEHQLVRLTIRQPGDLETEFRFGDWKENVPIDEAKFHFQPPPGVAIVDDAALASKVQ